MTSTVTLDRAGRIVLPKKIRDSLDLVPGTTLRVDVVGDRLEMIEAPKKMTLVKKGSRRVVVGWKGFDAAASVQEMRDEQTRAAGRCAPR